MPIRPKKACNYPLCTELVDKGYCEKHKKEERQRYDKQRGTSHERGYTGRWSKLRNYYIKQHPLCEVCKAKGIIKVAEIVHHIIPIQQGGELLNTDNLKSVCNRCHEDIHYKDRFKRG